MHSITTIIFVLISLTASAQITTDRLGTANLPQTVSSGSIQLETGIEIKKLFYTSSYQLPSIALRYGLTDQLEVRLSTQYQVHLLSKELQSISAYNRKITEWGPSLIGLKFDLGKSANEKWHFAIQSDIGIHRGSGILSGYRLSPVSRLIVAQRISDRMQIIHNLILDHYGFRLRGLMTYAPQLRYEANDNLSVMIEPSVSYGGAGSHPFNNIGAGLAYRIGEHFQFDLSMYLGTTFRYHKLSIGASYLFGKR